MSKIKTLHLTNSWHENSGGVATFYRALLAAAEDVGHEIRLVVPGSETRVEEPSKTAKIYYLKSPQAPLNKNYRVIYPSRFLYPGTALQQILDYERPDLVEICDKYNLNYLGALLRIHLAGNKDWKPTVVGLSCERMDDNFATYIGHSRVGKLFSAVYMRWCYFPFFDHHIAVSEHTAAELRQASRGHRITRGVWVQPMGVDCDRFLPGLRHREIRNQICRRIGIPPEAFLLLYVGRLVPEKNLPLLLETLKLLLREPREYRLLLVGDGMERQALEERARRTLPGRISFLGFESDRRILAEIYANADVFLHPNPNEPFGIAPLEAMASGLPMVAPNAGGVLSFANPGNAFLVAPDAMSFADAVRTLAENPDLRAQTGKVARKTAESYRWSEATSNFLRLYAQLHEITAHGQQLTVANPTFLSKAPGRITSMLARAAAVAVTAGFRGVVRLRSSIRSFSAVPADEVTLLHRPWSATRKVNQ